ncbi:MAG: hypothetical protein Q7S71_03500, partial [Candidatus Nitrotoga sp.]|nr:hypothetical protein [Candidatus Nitrotoga sp.]
MRRALLHSFAGTSINPVFGRVASLRGARNPLVPNVHCGCCTPCAWHFIPKTEFLEAPYPNKSTHNLTMTASQFSALFVAALMSNAVVKLWLAYRQLHHVAAHRAEVPVAFREQVSIAAHHKAADYTRALVRLGILATLFDTALLLLFTLGGGIQWLSDWSSATFDGTLV